MDLSVENCRERQKKLVAEMEVYSVGLAVVADPRNVLYLTGFETPSNQASAVLLDDRARATLICGLEASPSAVDEAVSVESSILATQHLDHWRKVSEIARRAAGRVDSLVGFDRSSAAPLIPEWADGSIDLSSIFWQLRRRKDPDEVELIRRAVEVSEACYQRTREILEPGLNELELYGELYRTAVLHAGRSLPPLGNDFQFASPGGPPRNRQCEPGELLILDLGITLGGYSSDSCRTFRIDEASRTQRAAWNELVETLRFIEATVVAGHSCRKLYTEVKKRLDRSWPGAFFHHLGHGIGLSPHERPSLNPHWNHVFEEGDVFTAEPGIYSPELNAGIRLEEIYLLSETGLEKLTHFPLDL